MIETLPKGWDRATVAELIEIIDYRGRTPPYASSGIPHIRSANIRAGQIVWDKLKFIREDTYKKYMTRGIPQKGDLLFTTEAPLGEVADVPSCKFSIAQRVMVLRPNPNLIETIFFKFQIMSPDFQAAIRDSETGTMVSGISSRNFQPVAVIVAPLNEQRRIVAKLENPINKVQVCQQRLEKIPVILKRFRQSVLAAACSGRLTADWREGASSEGDWPTGWKKACVGAVIEDLKYGTSQKCSYDKKGVPVLRIPNVVNGIVDHADLKFAILQKQELTQLRLSAGDILIIRSNGSVSLVGKSAIVRESEKGFAYAGYLIRIRPNRTIIEPEFLNLALSSYDVRLQIEMEARSTSGVNNINSGEVRSLQLSLPPLKEQHEIVRRVKEFNVLADQIETRYAKAKAHVDKITQSILAKAFRGELVPQDPNDEPAEVLLKRIREGELADAPAEKTKSKAKSDRSVLSKNRKTLKSAAVRPQTRRAGLKKGSKK